jgi:hypothetical protein
VFDPRDKGAIFKEEQTSVIPSIEPTLEKRLGLFGVAMVKSIKELNNKDIKKRSRAPANKIGEKILKTFRNLAAASSIPGPPPEKVRYQQIDYLKKWILPVNNLHQDDATLSKYCHWPVLNSPENMPWDSSLNQDVHAAVQRHMYS